MTTRNIIIASAVFWTGIAWYNDKEILAAVFFTAHMLGYMLHVLEVKVNKLLDHHGIHVSRKDIAEG